MLHCLRLFSAILAAALFALGAPAMAQTTGGGTPGATSTDARGKLSKDDHDLLQDIAQANLAEIETGKMALEKGQSAEVKKFAQMMIDDHTKAMEELRTLAKAKGSSVPTETDVQHKAIATALKALSGETFDSQYIARVGVGDHERTHKLLEKTQREAKDADLKAYATKTIQVVARHLEAARKLEKKK